MWDGAVLAVATPQSTTPHLQKTLEEWEGICSEHGFEYIDSEAKGRNEFGGEYDDFRRLMLILNLRRTGRHRAT